MSDEFIAFIHAMDRCWMDNRIDDLSAFIADDVVMVAPGGAARMEGIAAAIESYRAFMSHSTVARYETAHPIVTHRGDAAVIEYGWNMAWTSGGTAHQAKGREILMLARRDGAWRVVWRTQLSS